MNPYANCIIVAILWKLEVHGYSVHQIPKKDLISGILEGHHQVICMNKVTELENTVVRLLKLLFCLCR